MGLVRQLEHAPYKRLRKSGLLSLEKVTWRPQSNLQVPEGGLQGSWEGFFIRNCTDRKRTNGYKLKERKSRPDICGRLKYLQ